MSGMQTKIAITEAAVTTKMAIAFSEHNWLGNSLTVIPSGVPTVPGEIGPHSLPIPRFYSTTVYRYLPGNIKLEETGLDIIHDQNTGTIEITKSGPVAAFAGVVMIFVI